MSLIERYTQDYLGKVFYFCLKKTGNEEDAADLAGNINYEILKSIDRGNEPDNFEAWVWAVARNQWAKWADKTFYKAPEQVDLQDYAESLPAEDNVAEEIIRSEELDVLRRELAFIRSDYRQILVAHYFDEMSVATISEKFCIPLGTVKTKLISSRNILKEGMNMAREFGQKSFKPETILFTASGWQPSGLPWRAVQRLIPMNILCAADNNPSTLEELSMELGIAVPYMEEEVAMLEDAELLRKVGKDKYLTNFFISPKECQSEMNELGCRFMEKTYEEIWELAKIAVEKLKEIAAIGGNYKEEDLTAFFAFRIEQTWENEVLPWNIYNKFKRKDGGDWGFIGWEAGGTCRLPRMTFSMNGNMAEHISWFGFQCIDVMDGKQQDYGRKPYTLDAPETFTCETLWEIAKGKKRSDFSSADQANVNTLIKQGFISEANGELTINAPVMSAVEEATVIQYIRYLPRYHKLCEYMNDYIENAIEIVKKYSLSYLEEDFDYYVAMSNTMRSIASRLWKDKGLYTGDSAQFCVLTILPEKQ